MESGAVAQDGKGGRPRRLWTLLPILLPVGAVSPFTSTGGSLPDLVGSSPPPADESAIRRIELRPGEIRVRVTNPQRQAITIGSVAVDDAVVPFTADGPATLGRLRSSSASSGCRRSAAPTDGGCRPS